MSQVASTRHGKTSVSLVIVLLQLSLALHCCLAQGQTNNQPPAIPEGKVGWQLKLVYTFPDQQTWQSAVAFIQNNQQTTGTGVYLDGANALIKAFGVQATDIVPGILSWESSFGGANPTFTVTTLFTVTWDPATYDSATVTKQGQQLVQAPGTFFSDATTLPTLGVTSEAVTVLSSPPSPSPTPSPTPSPVPSPSPSPQPSPVPSPTPSPVVTPNATATAAPPPPAPSPPAPPPVSHPPPPSPPAPSPPAPPPPAPPSPAPPSPVLNNTTTSAPPPPFPPPAPPPPSPPPAPPPPYPPPPSPDSLSVPASPAPTLDTPPADPVPPPPSDNPSSPLGPVSSQDAAAQQQATDGLGTGSNSAARGSGSGTGASSSGALAIILVTVFTVTGVAVAGGMLFVWHRRRQRARLIHDLLAPGRGHSKHRDSLSMMEHGLGDPAHPSKSVPLQVIAEVGMDTH